MKNYLLLFLTLLTIASQSQSDQINQDKYWKYRELLKQKFTKIGTDYGESIPMACRIPGYAYGGTLDPAGTQLQWKDATITLGYYLIVLGTEFKLLQQQGQDVTACQNELYYALQAINRLDRHAENYLSGSNNFPDVTNGFLLRDDVPDDFWQNWENDKPIYPNLMSDPGNPNRADSDHSGLDDTTGQPLSAVNQGNAESKDQITSLLTGLLTVFKMVDETVVQPTQEDAALNLKAEAKAIALRMIEYVMVDEFDDSFSPRFMILDQDGNMVTRGPDCLANAWAFHKIVEQFGPSAILDQLNELFNMTIPISVRAEDLFDILSDINGVCLNSLENNVSDFIDENGSDAPFTVARIPYNTLLEFIDKLQNEQIDLEINSITACFDVQPSDVENLNTIEPALPGVCDNILFDVFLNRLLSAFSSFLNSIPDLGEEICVQPNTLNADVVHILLENMVVSDIWDDPEYIADVAEMDFPYLNLLHTVLHTDSEPNSAIDVATYKQLLDAAPCEGPWQDPLNLANHAPGNWASACNLFKGFGETGPTTGSGDNIQPWKEYSGYFPGIDYMVLHNLYYLV
jgi:hypothetical protein